MEIELLREYLVIADQLSLTEAAKSLCTTQSTLSKHLARLESEFSCSLVKRARHGLELTREGVALWRRAAAIVDSYDGAVREIREMGETASFKVTGLLQNGEVLGILSLASQLLHDEGSSSSLAACFSTPFFESLVQGDSDLVLTHWGTEGDDLSGISSVELLKQPFIALVEPGHRFYGKRSISFSDLKGEPLVHLVGEYSKTGWQTIKSVCEAHGFEPREYPVVADSPTDFFTLQLGESVLILQRDFLAGGLLFSGRYKALKVVDDDAFFTLKAYYRKSDEQALSGVLSVLAAAAQKFDEASSSSSRAGYAPLEKRCEEIAQKMFLNESEQAAMTLFAKGHSIERIGQEMGLTRMIVGDLLASVYQKLGLSDRQDLIDLIEAEGI